MMTTILVTGSAGQLGKEWVDFLYRREDVRLVACSSTDLDVGDRGAVRRMLNRERPDTVINCAAYTNVDQAEDEPEKAMRVNRDGVSHLAGWCGEHACRLVHFSTDYVFPGRREDREKFPDGYPEEALTGPVNSYGRSKLAGEQELLRSSADVLLVRVSWLCGRYGDNFVKKMIRLGRSRNELNVVSDQLGSPSWTDSVVHGVYELLKRQEQGIFHMTSTGVISWYELAEEIFRQLGMQLTLHPVESHQFPTRASRPSFSKLDTSKISGIDGIETEEWRQGLGRLIHQLNKGI